MNLKNIRITLLFKWLLYIISFVLGIFLILAFYSQQQGWGLNYLFNSDILYFPTLFKDLFIDHYRPEGWYIPGSPGFFPDMLLYFIIMSIVGSPVLSSCIYSIVQFTLIMVLFNILIRQVLQEWNLYLLTVSNLMFILIVLVGIAGRSYLITFHVLSNTYHLGAFVNALFALIFSFYYIRFNKNKYLYFLFVISLVAIVSDRLFMTLYTIPFLIALVPWIRKKNLVIIGKLFGVNLLGSITGIVCFNLLRNSKSIHIHHLYLNFSTEKIIKSFHVLMEQMKDYIVRWNLFSFVLIGCIIFTIVLIIILIINRKEIFNNRLVVEKRSIYMIFILFSLLFMLLVFWTPVLLGDYLAGSKMRYNVFVFYYGMLAFAPLISIAWNSSSGIKRLYLYIFVILLTFHIATAAIMINMKDFKSGLKRYFNHYPDIAKLMDEMNLKYPLKHGISTYWNTKVGTLFSKANVRLYTVYDANMVPYRHVCNENWYYETGYGKYDPPVFNFMIFSKDESLEPVYALFGEPLAKEVWGDFIFLLVNDFIYSRDHKFPIPVIPPVSKQEE